MEFNSIGIDIGHNVIHDIGAFGIKEEDKCNKEVGELVIKYLKERGKKVTLCTPVVAASLGESLYLRTTVANRDKVDLYVSIHFNIGGGHGTEAWAMSIVGQAVGQNIINAISQLGYTNRGVKDGSSLYVVRNTEAPAVLIECAFLDSKEDMNRYNADDIAKAIVYGLTGVRIEAPKPIEEAPKVEAPKEDKPSGSLTNPLTLELQRTLNRLGIIYNNSKLAEDGMNGTYTMGAVKRFQSIFNLTVDGVAGEKTWGAISEILAKPLLKMNYNADKTIAIKYLQWRLCILTDGIFGNDTTRSLRRFQIDYKLEVDGICGSETWKKLIG